MGLHILVLAGGSGTRLWPMSRRSTPKHLLPLAPGGVTLLRATLERVIGLGDSVHVVTAAAQADGCRETLAELGLPHDSIIVGARATRDGTGARTGGRPHRARRSGCADRERPRRPSRQRSRRVPRGGARIGRVGGEHRRSGDSRARPRRPGHRVRLHRARRSPRSGTSGAPRPEPNRCSPPPLRRCRRSPRSASRRSRQRRWRRHISTDGHHLWNLGLFAWTARRFLAELEEADPALRAALREVVDARARGDERTASSALRGAACAGCRATRPGAHAAPHRRRGVLRMVGPRILVGRARGACRRRRGRWRRQRGGR